MKAVRKVVAQLSLAPLVTEEVEPGRDVQSDEAIGEWIKAVVTTMWHPVGTRRRRGGRAFGHGRLSGVRYGPVIRTPEEGAEANHPLMKPAYGGFTMKGKFSQPS